MERDKEIREAIKQEINESVESVASGEMFVIPESWTPNRRLAFVIELSRKIKEDSSLLNVVFKWVNAMCHDNPEYGVILTSILTYYSDDMNTKMLESAEWTTFSNTWLDEVIINYLG